MKYCPRCQILAEDTCPVCSRKTREVEPTDPVLLLMCGSIHADMAEPVLDDHQIPYARMGNLGVGITMYTSLNFETYRFYVPYESIPAARSALEEVFGEDREFMEHLIPEIQK